MKRREQASHKRTSESSRIYIPTKRDKEQTWEIFHQLHTLEENAKRIKYATIAQFPATKAENGFILTADKPNVH